MPANFLPLGQLHRVPLPDLLDGLVAHVHEHVRVVRRLVLVHLALLQLFQPFDGRGSGLHLVKIILSYKHFRILTNLCF